MACIGLALGLRAVIGATDDPIIAKAVAELFIFCAILIFWAAPRRCRATLNRVDDHDANTQSHQNMALTATVITTGAVASGAILWLL